jgi:intracellular multiplication protein IcmQ
MGAEKDHELKALKRFVEILDETLSTGMWEETFLLKSMKKKLSELREEAQQLQQQYREEAMAKSIGAGNAAMDTLQTVYISVFQQDFADLRKWERMLKSITDYSITRPVYKEEDHVKEMIRGRPDPNKEGYVAAMVKKEDIVKGFAGKATADKSGYELLNIKEGGIRPGGIRRLVLGSRTFEFVDGALKLIQAETTPKQE